MPGRWGRGRARRRAGRQPRNPMDDSRSARPACLRTPEPQRRHGRTWRSQLRAGSALWATVAHCRDRQVRTRHHGVDRREVSCPRRLPRPADTHAWHPRRRHRAAQRPSSNACRKARRLQRLVMRWPAGGRLAPWMAAMRLTRRCALVCHGADRLRKVAPSTVDSARAGLRNPCLRRASAGYRCAGWRLYGNGAPLLSPHSPGEVTEGGMWPGAGVRGH